MFRRVFPAAVSVSAAVAAFALQAGLVASSAQGAVTITQGASAPSYDNHITFDEPGTPTGAPVAVNYWAPKGVPSISSASGPKGLISTGPDGTNTYYGNGGIYIVFAQPVTLFSCQYWDDSANASFFGGGANVFATNASGGTIFQTLTINSPSSLNANPWINIVAAAGSSFSQVWLQGGGDSGGNFADAKVDNISWSVPAPGSCALLGIGSLVAFRRRRA